MESRAWHHAASHAAFLGVLYDDVSNTALRQALSTHLSVCELCALVQVCTAFRSWLVGHGAQLFLGVTALDIVGGNKVLRAWQPHFLLNGQPAMCKKRTILITPRVYSCYGRAADGRQLVHEVPPGAKVDTERSAVTLRLVHASTRAEAEVLLRNMPLFTKKQTSKGAEKDYSNTYHMGIHIRETLSRHQTPPGTNSSLKPRSSRPFYAHLEQRVGPTRDRPLLPFAPPFPPCPFLRPHLRCARFGMFCRLLRLFVSGNVPRGGGAAPRAQGHEAETERLRVHQRRLLRGRRAAQKGQRDRARAARGAAQALEHRLTTRAARLRQPVGREVIWRSEVAVLGILEELRVGRRRGVSAGVQRGLLQERTFWQPMRLSWIAMQRSSCFPGWCQGFDVKWVERADGLTFSKNRRACPCRFALPATRTPRGRSAHRSARQGRAAAHLPKRGLGRLGDDAVARQLVLDARPRRGRAQLVGKELARESDLAHGHGLAQQQAHLLQTQGHASIVQPT